MVEIEKTFPVLIKTGKKKFMMIGHITIKEISSEYYEVVDNTTQELVDIGLRKEMEEFIINKHKRKE